MGVVDDEVVDEAARELCISFASVPRLGPCIWALAHSRPYSQT
jgi:hypothetical protein